MDHQNILGLMQNAMTSPNQEIRDQSLKQLDHLFMTVENMQILMEMLQLDNQMPLIYFNYWLRQAYKELPETHKEPIQQMVIQLYCNKPTDHMIKAIVYMVVQDYPSSMLFEWANQLDDLTLKYRIVKELYPYHGSSDKLISMCQRSLQQIKTMDVKSMKQLILCTKFVKYQQGQLIQYITTLDQLLSQPDTNSHIIYLWQKLIYKTLQHQGPHQNYELIQLVNFLDKHYFSNPHFKSTDMQFNDLNEFEQILTHVKANHKNEQQTLKLVHQIVLILKHLALNYSFGPLSGLDSDPQLEESLQEFELVLYEVYFPKILQFLTNYALLMSPTQIHDIYYQPENFYAEEDNAAYHIREVAIDFISNAMNSMKADEIRSAIVKAFENCQTLHISQFNEIIQKEAVYFIIKDTMQDIEFDFDAWLPTLLNELSNKNKLMLPIQIQILNIIKNELSNNDEMPQDVIDRVVEALLLMESNNLCLMLLQIECLTHVIQFINPQLMLQLWQKIQQIYAICQHEQSKITIYEFFTEIFKRQIVTDLTWIFQQFFKEWDSKQLNIQQKILELLKEFIQKDQLQQEQLGQCLFVLKSAFGMGQAILTDYAIEALLQMQSRCNELHIQMSPEYIEYFQTVLRDSVADQSNYWIHGILMQTYFITSEQYNDQLVIESFVKQLKQFDDIKETHFIKIFIPLEIYIRKQGVNAAKICRFAVELLIKCSGMIQLKLVHILAVYSYLNNTTQDIISPQLLCQMIPACCQMHCLQPELMVQHFQYLILLIQSTQQMQGVLEECLKKLEAHNQQSLESEGNYLGSGLRAIVNDGFRGLRVPDVKFILLHI